MSLESYKKKRKFSQTPEPKGVKAKRSGPLHFMIHKHAATRLHYDLRLELDGVLLSWAVPKGPSLNPADKRLAMKVEDHPFDYKEFEGIIPKGNYGAGTVMIWDEGTYTDYEESQSPQAIRKNLKAGLEKGDFKIRLNGTKIKGAYVLAKLKQDDNAWLLIKKQDEHSSADDITEQDYSVRTNRTMTEIASGESAQALDLSWAPKAEQPKLVKPMLATLIDTPFDNPDWWFEIKWDGYRIISNISDRQVSLHSRNDKDYTQAFAPISQELSKIKLNCILDGEVVVVDSKGKSDFGALQNYQKTHSTGSGQAGQGNLVYYVFDCLFADGRDLRGGSLRQRREALKSIVKGFDNVKISDHIVERGSDFFKLAQKNQLEGIIAKDAESKYISKRSNSWLKIKTQLRQDAVIGGWTEPKGSRNHMGSLTLGVYDKGELVYIGQSGGGFDEKGLSAIYKLLKPLEIKKSPFSSDFKTPAPPHWVKPKLVCEVSFSEWTSDGLMRHPVFLGLRYDKDPKKVVREIHQTEPEINNPTSQPRSSRRNSATGLNTKVELTNLGKVYWPKEGYTKGDLISYYNSIADIILPHLSDRPESLNRHPNGINGQSFFQKDLEHHQDWVKTVPIFSESNNKDINWLVANDRDTLIYMANLGCIEINPWHSRVNELDKPDYCLIDLDAKTCTFDEVITVAKAAYKLLEELGIPSFPKTSGKTGMHICIPLGAQYSFDQSRIFAQILVNLLNDRLPKMTSVERSPSKRTKKIYLDYLQNRKGQTMAAPYCVRPVEGATVSTPLEWNEVKKGINPQKFTIKTINKRLEKKGDLWLPVLGKGVKLDKIIGKLA